MKNEIVLYELQLYRDGETGGLRVITAPLFDKGNFPTPPPFYSFQVAIHFGEKIMKIENKKQMR